MNDSSKSVAAANWRRVNVRYSAFAFGPGL